MTRRKRNNTRTAPRAGIRVIQNIARSFSDVVQAKSGAFAGKLDLCRNDTGSPATDNTNFLVGQKYRVSQLLFNGQVESQNAGDINGIENLTLWVIKVPEGYTFSNTEAYWNFPYKHPEWVLGWKFYGNPVNSSTSAAKPEIGVISLIPVRSNRTTILQPGDRISAFLTGNGAPTLEAHNILLTGIVDYRLTVM